MGNLKIAICDDDSNALEAEKNQLDRTVSGCGVKCEITAFNNPRQLLESSEKIELCFLDVEMEGFNGIETAEALHKKNPGCLIFFVTNHDCYMDEALNKHAFRFWTKPMDDRRLCYGIESAIKELRSRKKFLKITVNKKPVNILQKNIIFACTENRVTKIVTVDGEIETKDLFKNIKQQLTLDCFCEVHASYYINMNYVTGYTPSTVTCSHSDKSYNIMMSKRKAASFLKNFAKWSGGTV